ncbi:NAD(P)/FAD-dependent oxidoreductase [Amycolatopsis rubida]|uniref:NAD(P)/FAD-dependent oxidoreductase n=1 Tax=Amycolatopsis rubida TaxID=112413 RepID=A0ABX0BRR2_9PSEU|nr:MULTISPECIES: NAD(P)/FAD-dependent oxidoreductase [Amycolatopsis]MYW91328.1 NAD(P)-binding protein [Amycolatopsis rubida]NEC56313.1 NAD(P)/FAD-dependent oxidoreductase [Amycolatopsis rubida]OAP28908.1 putative thiazole biosynthetic enzyme [Amycolatopsis sp. M39]
MTTAVVVGSGPNGLAAAAVLARAGVDVTVLEAAGEIGGGTRTSEAIVPGLRHDHCSATHPMAVGSPVLTDLGLDQYGLRWQLPEIDCVHPLDDGTAGVLRRSVSGTAAGLGPDERRWSALFSSPARNYDALSEDILGPLLRVPKHPLLLGRFGLPTVAPATVLARCFGTEQARALWLGVAAHAFRPLDRPLSSAIGLGIITAGHRHGWAVAEGGSRAISDALAALVADFGGKIETGVRVESVSRLPRADVVVWDVGPDTLAQVLGDRLPPRIRRAYERFRYGPGAFKVDFAVQGGIPWRSPEARAAGTVHLGGSAAEIAAGEREVHNGRMPERPFVLLGQQYLADPSRSVGDVHPVWAYAHVPHGYAGDATEAITAQIERFAPGFRDRVIGSVTTSSAEFAAGNPNFVGGNILTGAKDTRQLVFGPRTTLQPYDMGVPGHFVCSAATPPGPGAHGMCGSHAAARALRYLRR